MNKLWVKCSALLAVLGCGDSEEPPTAPEASTPCEERSFEECEDDRCYAVRATKLELAGALLCRLGEQKLSCRTRGPDCADDDATSLSCDADGGYWFTPQTCIPADHTLCDAPDGADASYPVCNGCDQLAPPPVTMRTAQDTQSGVQGSFCIRRPEGQCSLCSEQNATVANFVSVTEGEKLSFDSGDAKLVAGTRCSPACPPTLRIQPAGDDGPITETRLLGDDQTWTVDLAPGTYELWLDTHHESSSSEGQVYVGFGLKVESDESAVP